MQSRSRISLNALLVFYLFHCIKCVVDQSVVSLSSIVSADSGKEQLILLQYLPVFGLRCSQSPEEKVFLLLCFLCLAGRCLACLLLPLSLS